MIDNKTNDTRPQQTSLEHFGRMVSQVGLMLVCAGISNTLVTTLFLSWGTFAAVTATVLFFVAGCVGYVWIFVHLWSTTDKDIKNTHETFDFILLLLMYLFMPLVVCIVLLTRQIVLNWLMDRIAEGSTSQNQITVDREELGKTLEPAFIRIAKLLLPTSLKRVW